MVVCSAGGKGTPPQERQAKGAGGAGSQQQVPVWGDGGDGEERSSQEAGPAPEPVTQGGQQAGASGSGRPARDAGGEGAAGQEEEESPAVRVALSMLRWYRSALSPLMPSTCRFLPSCSVYSMDAYKKHGVWRGSVLTAWRLMRCNPWGGHGYDPVRWPPVGLEAVYRHPYTPEVTVVLGAALVYYTISTLITTA